MKIREALALRADLQRRLEQLKQRLIKNARIQEGDAPEEDPAAGPLSPKREKGVLVTVRLPSRLILYKERTLPSGSSSDENRGLQVGLQPHPWRKNGVTLASQ